VLPPVAVTISFIDSINRGDLEALEGLLHEDHQLEVFDEPPLVGRDANVEAWDGYFDSFPDYVIYPRHITEDDAVVAVLGHTTGSHLQMPDDEERRLTLIWVAHVADGRLHRWRLLEDTIQARREFGLSG
jgi:ketosteroid isomerase-like protein